MKKILLISMLFTSFNVLAQITLETTYPVTTNSYAQIHYIKTSTSEKFAIPDESTNIIKIYNINHSLFKTINIPALIVGPGSVVTDKYFFAITDDLFNTDAKFEYLLEYSAYNSSTSKYGSFVYVYNEDGTVLFSKDSARVEEIETIAISEVPGIVKTSTGSKLIIRNDKYNDRSIEVYSLPGNLSSSASPLKFIPGLSYPFPNPSSETTRIEFELPQGEYMGEILISSISGIPVKKYLVDNSFGDLLLNNSDLPTGTYLYQLKAGNNVSETKKMMIIK